MEHGTHCRRMRHPTLDLLVDDICCTICERKRFKDLLRTARVIAKVVRNHTLVHVQYTEIGGTAIDNGQIPAKSPRQLPPSRRGNFALSLNKLVPQRVALVLPLRRVQ